MNLFGQKKYNYISVLLLSLVLLSTSCSGSAPPEPEIAEVTSPPAGELPVEYGASLSEWEEATQADIEQTANRDGTNTEAAEFQEIAAVEIIPTAVVASDEVTYSGQASDATSAEEPRIPTEQTANRDEISTEAIESQEAAVAETAPAVAIASDEVASAGEAADATPAEEPVITDENASFIFNDVAYEEIMWDGLIPTDFTPAAIMTKYEEQLAQLADGSSEASDLYAQMQEELNNAPVNEALNETFVRLPGFIAPLEYTDDRITEFLLVPYFGACIHVPPPPSNQTVLVKTSKENGIKPEDAFNPIWVMGKMTTEGISTELAEAGYYMQDAFIEPYTSP